VVTWSRPRVVVANQFRTEHQPQQQQQQRYEDPKAQEARSQESYERGEETDGSEEETQSGQASSEHSDDDEHIPFGQNLGCRETVIRFRLHMTLYLLEDQMTRHRV